MMLPALWLVPRAVADAAGPWDEISSPTMHQYYTRVATCSRACAFLSWRALLLPFRPTDSLRAASRPRPGLPIFGRLSCAKLSS